MVSLAGRIDLALLSPELGDDDVARGCQLAAELGLACVLVRPSDLEMAMRAAAGAAKIGSVLDHPYGYSTTGVKQYAARDLLRRGAKEIETPVNLGKLKSRQFQYLEMELQQIAGICHEAGATFKVSIDAPKLTDELTMLSCRILRRAGADMLCTNAPESIGLIREHARERLAIKLYGGIAGLDAALAACESGCARIEASSAESAEAVLNEWKARRAANPAPSAVLS